MTRTARGAAQLDAVAAMYREMYLHAVRRLHEAHVEHEALQARYLRLLAEHRAMRDSRRRAA